MKLTSILGAGAALLLVAAPALAQTTRIEPAAASSRPTSLDKPSGSPASDSGLQGVPGAFDGIPAGELIGKSVYNTGGENIGEIDDIVLNRSNNAAAALVAMGRFLGTGERHVVVLLNDLELQGDNIVVRNLTRTDFERKAAYQPNDWARHDRNRAIGATVRAIR